MFRYVTLTLLAFPSSLFGDLQGEIEQIVRSASLNQGTAGICLIDTATGEMLASVKGERTMIPASNQKLLTTGTALHVLGPAFAFNTQLQVSGNNLIVIGDGDPTFGDPELLGIDNWQSENEILKREFKPWIQAVRSTGLKEIDTIYIDDRVFDQNFVHPSWPADQINNWYCAQVAGINYHLNVVHFFPSPNQSGRANLGNIAPQMNWLNIGNKTTSKTGEREKSSFWVARTPNSNNMTARGNVKSAHLVPVRIAFHDPPIVFGEALASQLRSQGVSVGNVERVPKHANLQGKTIYSRKVPLHYALQRSNRDSHNMYAESLLKRIAAASSIQAGSFDVGATIVEKAVAQRIGETLRELNAADGSGMSRMNQVSPTILAKWLASFNVMEPTGRSLLLSLATPGNGTLKDRFNKIDLSGATIHAKSGYLRGVCSLSGYIVFPRRAPIVFSIIVNDVQGTVKGAKKMQEAIVLAAIHNSSVQ